MIWFLFLFLAQGAVPWVDLSEVDSSIALDTKRFPSTRGRRHVADSCWLRKPVAVALHRASSGLRLERRRLWVSRCYVPLRQPCAEPCASKKELATGGVVELTLRDALAQPILPYEKTEAARLSRALEREGFSPIGDGLYRWKTAFPAIHVPHGDLTNRDKAAERLTPITE